MGIRVHYSIDGVKHVFKPCFDAWAHLDNMKTKSFWETQLTDTTDSDHCVSHIVQMLDNWDNIWIDIY